ncbi:hypothetical protein Droror1_Dr00013169 [Drosera rotundifolia]
MLLLESATMSLQFRPHFTKSNCGRFWSSEELGGVNHVLSWNRVSRHGKRVDNCFMSGTNKLRRTIRAHAKRLVSGSDQEGDNEKSGYHPFEDILISEDMSAEERQLTAAEKSRTMVEVHFA